jgi:hypothetical protein
MGTLKAFIVRNHIRAESVMVDHNPNMDGSQNMDNYKVTLRRKGRQLTIPFSMGVALCREPSAEDVLDCLASDSSSYENYAGSFEDWCGEFGYDTDSRKAERTYNVCGTQAGKLKRFLGEDLYKELLWDTERL